MSFLKSFAVAGAMLVGATSFATASTVSVLAEGNGVNPYTGVAVIDFTVSYNPVTDGSAAEQCGSGVPCLEQIVIDLTAGANESNAQGSNLSFIGLSPEGARAGGNFEFAISDGPDANSNSDNSAFNLLTITALNNVFDRGNVLQFSAEVTGLGQNTGGNFADRFVEASVLLSDGTFGSGVFVTVQDGFSSQVDIAPVPLPASALLLLAGVGGLGAMRFRKNKKA